MGRIFKLLLVLAILGFIGLVGYAYVADLAPKTGTVTEPVVLNGN